MTENGSEIDVEVAGLHYGLGGDWDGMEFPGGWNGAAEVAFEDRTRVTLRVHPRQSIVSVLDAAADGMGIRAQWDSTGKPFVGFWREASQPFGRINTYVPIVEKDGTLVWEPDWHGLPYADVIRTGEMGLLGGDHRRLELVLLPAHGDWHVSWAEMVAFWQNAEPVLDDVLRITGAAGLAHGTLKILRRAVTKGREAVDSRFREWNRRNATPHHLAALLESATATEEDFASGLGLTVEQFRALHLLMGFAPRGSDAGEREVAAALRELRRIGEIIAHETTTVERGDVVRRELQALFTTTDAGTVSATLARWSGPSREAEPDGGHDPYLDHSWLAEEELRAAALSIMQAHMKRKPRDADFALKVFAMLRSS